MGLIRVSIEGLPICVIDKHTIFDYIHYIIIKYCFLLLEFCSKKNKTLHYWFQSYCLFFNFPSSYPTRPTWQRHRAMKANNCDNFNFWAHITKKKRDLHSGHVLFSLIGVTHVFRHQYYWIQPKQTICEISQVRIQHYSCTIDRKTSVFVIHRD